MASDCILYGYKVQSRNNDRKFYSLQSAEGHEKWSHKFLSCLENLQSLKTLHLTYANAINTFAKGCCSSITAIQPLFSMPGCINKVQTPRQHAAVHSRTQLWGLCTMEVMTLKISSQRPCQRQPKAMFPTMAGQVCLGKPWLPTAAERHNCPFFCIAPRYFDPQDTDLYN